MTVSKTKLASKYGILAKKLDLHLIRGKKLGIETGLQRIELVCERYEKIAPDVALSLIDLASLQAEIEDAQFRSRRIQLAHLFRNILSLLPLMATWFALFWAVRGYQMNLQLHPADNTTPFLQQWQGGFRNTTWFTFTFAAGLDVFLLVLYLLAVLGSQWFEQRAQKIAARFINDLREDIDELMTIIASTSISPITGPEDVDKVVKAVTNVMDHALAETDKLMQAAQQAISDSQDQVSDMFKNQVIPLMGSFQTDTNIFKTSLGKFEADLHSLNKSIRQLAADTSTMEKHATSYLTIGTEMNTHLSDLQTTQKDLVGELNGFSGNITSAIGGVKTAASSMEKASDAVNVAATDLDHGLQLTVTRVTDSVDRATAFQKDLGIFVTELDRLNKVTENLTTTSGKLAAQVGAMGDQVANLQLTQDQVSRQLTAVVTYVAAAADNMATATTSVTNVATSLNTVAQSMNTGITSTIAQMTNNIDRSTRALGQVENSLGHLIPAITQAVDRLAAYSPATSGSGGGGFIDWLLRRRSA